MSALRTLLFAGGEVHDFASTAPVLHEILSAAGDFDVTRVDEDLSVLEAPGLDPYELLVFYYTIGSITDAQKNGLLNWVASGRGFVGIHSGGTCSFLDCPEFTAMVGGRFLSHPPYRRFPVSVVDPEHPITLGMDEFEAEDELYLLDYDPRVQVLAAALHRGAAMPVAWIKPWGAGRVFYLSLGHDATSCRQPGFAALLVNGARWSARPAAEE
jgi:hypothetical protein